MIKQLLRKTAFTSKLLDIYFFSKFYLKPKGWTQSRHSKMPIDQNGNPIPWFTYSLLYFLEPKLKNEHKVLEYGSGNSTLWFASKTKEVVSIEHELSYYNLLKPKFDLISNIQYTYSELDKDYHLEGGKFSDYFDILIIDGRHRVRCLEHSLVALKKTGVIIFDDTIREEYARGYDILENLGFKAIDFRGVKPIGYKESQTTLFYRKENVLGI